MKLSTVRKMLGILSFAAITLTFLDFAGIFPQSFFLITKIQLVPALLSGAFLTVGVLLLLTWIFGRIYCSVICPLGVYQDLVAWIYKRFKPKRKFRFSPPKTSLRLAFLALVVVGYFAGFTLLLNLFEPYSVYGRITTHVARPLYMAGNNLLAEIAHYFGSYTFYNVHVFTLSLFALAVSILSLAAVSLLATIGGRSWCNTVCPVGTVLGWISKYSLFQIRFQADHCTHCNRCARDCKASCIDSKTMQVDTNRCVMCFNCLDACQEQALVYKIQRPEHNAKKQTAKNGAESTKGMSRRDFLKTTGGVAGMIGVSALASAAPKQTKTPIYVKQHPISPPSAGSTAALLDACTACQLCITECPSNVLKPAFMEYGMGGMMQPRMDFNKGYCNYDCTRCTEVCPTGALKPLTTEQKHRTQMGHVVFIKTSCVVYTDETSCGACSEHCPTQAVKMVPYKNGLTIPEVEPDICVGCGGCEYICPVRPLTAIYVEGNPVHLEAQAFETAKKEHVELDGFGF